MFSPQHRPSGLSPQRSLFLSPRTYSFPANKWNVFLLNLLLGAQTPPADLALYVCVRRGCLLLTPFLIFASSSIKRQGSSLTTSIHVPAAGPHPGSWVTNLHLVFPSPSSLPGPFPFSPLSLARPSHSWVFVMLGLDCLVYILRDQELSLPAVTISLLAITAVDLEQTGLSCGF